MTFYILSGLLFILMYPSVRLLPNETPIKQKVQTLSLLKVIKNPRVLCFFFYLMNISASACYNYPLWTPLMNTVYDVNESIAAILLSFAFVGYILSLILLPIFLKR